MKTVLIAINSKYIHSSLAAWYLKSAAGDSVGEVKVLEFTINDNIDNVLSSIYLEKADVLAFSCYIWNIEYVLNIAHSMKSLESQAKIVMGGPEVSYDVEDLMKQNEFVDFVLCGEAEDTFPALLMNIRNNTDNFNKINGLWYREGSETSSSGGFNLIKNIDSIPSPYTDEMLSLIGQNRILYYESLRGCPFSCSYCISSTFDGVRYLDMERVKRDILAFIEDGVKQVKFVDRTFNCNKARAKEIIEFVIANPGNTNFHFEVAGDLFDDELLDIISHATKGCIQFEIGIQTINNDTLEIIQRKTDLHKLFKNVSKLLSFNNCHIHVDLIAGLPAEDLGTFICSFNSVYALKAHQLQLGFLKLLKGSKIRSDASKYEYVFKKKAPYEILSNKFLSYDDLIKLKNIEELVERYYNSGKFKETVDHVINALFESPFSFYEELSTYWIERGFYKRSVSSRELYTILLAFLKEYKKFAEENDDFKLIKDLLKFDFLVSDPSNNLPDGLQREVRKDFSEQVFEFLKNEENISRYIPKYEGVPAKQIFKKVHVEIFNFNFIERPNTKEKTPILFDYTSKDSVDGVFRSMIIEGHHNFLDTK